VHWVDDVFLKDTTTRRMVLASPIGPLVTARAASVQRPGVPAAGLPPPPSPPPFGGPPACADAATPIVVAANTITATNVPDGFMILQLLMALGCRVTIQFGTLHFIIGTKVAGYQ
jgi:hypothetical protein